MKKIFRTLLTAVASLGLALGFAVSPASAAVTPSTIYIGGPAGSVNDCSTVGSIGIFSDSAHTTPVTSITGTSGRLDVVNDCQEYAIGYVLGVSSGTIAGKAFLSGSFSSSYFTPFSSGTLSFERCARDAGSLGSAGVCNGFARSQISSTVSVTLTSNNQNNNNQNQAPAYTGPIGTTSAASVTTTGLVAGQTNPNPITVKMKVTTGNTADAVVVNMPTGWTWVSPVASQSPCVSTLPIDSYTGFTFSFCRASNGNTLLSQLTSASELFLRNSSGSPLAAGTEVTIVIKSGALNVGSGTEFVIGFSQGSGAVDKATVSVGASTASATPVKGTAAALATIPKASKAPKLSFDSSSNGLGKSSKKSLKKVATVAKDGYGVRVTGAAGMQPGVSRDVVKALAKKRAMEIRAYLIKQGVPKEDIIIKTKIFPIGKAPSTLVKVETLS